MLFLYARNALMLALILLLNQVYLNMLHPDYSKLAARVCVSELHKNTKENFADFVEDLKNYKDLAGK